MPVAGYDVEVTDTIQKDGVPRCPGALELPLRRLRAILSSILNLRLRRGFLILDFAHLGFEEGKCFIMVIELLLIGAV